MYAVKEILNYDMEELQKKSARAHKALEGDARYVEVNRWLDRFNKYDLWVNLGFVVFLGGILFLGFLSTAENSSPVHFLIFTGLFGGLIYLYTIHYKYFTGSDKYYDERYAIFEKYMTPSVRFFEHVRNKKIVACFGNVSEEDPKKFNVIFSVDEEDDFSEYEIQFNFDSESLAFAGDEWLVLDVGNEKVYFKSLH